MSAESETTPATERIHPPYIWFGGKRKVAPQVWAALGDVDNYIEPFFGGGAVWLLRPHAPRLETINDYDGFVANFWRAVQRDPLAVADAMNRPVNEVDLESMHRYLCRMPEKSEFLERMKLEIDYYDVTRAAYWCHGLNAWIGGGWCDGEYYPENNAASFGRGVCADANKLPHLNNAGRGIHRQLPHLGDAGCGIHRQRPHLGDTGRGIHRQLPHLGDAGCGEHARRGENLRAWMMQIFNRLRNVRVCCGDWERICTEGATSHGARLGIFLDPPYSAEAGRDNNIYRVEDTSVAHRVRAWCVERGPDKRHRIVLAGYDGEHNDLEKIGWRVLAWKAPGGYANFAADDTGRINATRERLWFSPHCPAANHTQQTIFGAES